MPVAIANAVKTRGNETVPGAGRKARTAQGRQRQRGSRKGVGERGETGRTVAGRPERRPLERLGEVDERLRAREGKDEVSVGAGGDKEAEETAGRTPMSASWYTKANRYRKNMSRTCSSPVERSQISVPKTASMPTTRPTRRAQVIFLRSSSETLGGASVAWLATKLCGRRDRGQPFERRREGRRRVDEGRRLTLSELRAAMLKARRPGSAAVCCATYCATSYVVSIERWRCSWSCAGEGDKGESARVAGVRAEASAHL